MLTPVPEAYTAICDYVSSLPRKTVRLPLHEARGNILAQDVQADRDYPPYDRVMMDGICLSSQSLGAQLRIAGTIHAGIPAERELSIGEVWRINTGAALPADCDLVIPVEALEISGDQVFIAEDFQPQPYQFVHRLGSDTQKGQVILPSGSHLNSAALSIAASVGSLELTVYQPPSVYVLTTGQEAISPEKLPNQFQIRRSHPTALSNALASLGIHNVTLHHLADDYEQMKAALQSALTHADCILTCGAISKGTSDYLGNLFRELIGEPTYHGISQRPGKPMAFWAHSPLVFALPGNAISTLVTFHRYVAPALQSMMGRPPTPPQTIEVSHDLPDFHLTRFLPVQRVSQHQATLLSPQNSGDFSQLAGSDGFVEIPLGTAPASPITLPYYPWH